MKVLGKKMNRKALNKMTIIVSIIFLVLIITNKEDFTFNYNKIDEYYDTNSTGRFLFVFLEVNSFNDVMMKEIPRRIYQRKWMFRDIDPTINTILTVYFYKKSDIERLPKDQINYLKTIYPKNKHIYQQINFVEEGWVYIRFTKRVKGFAGRDSLFKSKLYIPAKGYKAEKVLKYPKNYYK